MWPMADSSTASSELLRSWVRNSSDDAVLESAIGHIWSGRDDRYSELRGAQAADTGTGGRRVEMSYIGG